MSSSEQVISKKFYIVNGSLFLMNNLAVISTYTAAAYQRKASTDFLPLNRITKEIQ